MPLVIEESWLPATLTAPPMNDDEFAAFVSEHPDYFIEMTAEGELIIMPPNFTLTGIRNLEICRQLGNWSIEDCRGTASDASTGFVLPNGARRSPDAAWTQNSRINELDADSLDRYWHICPDFVIELRSPSDRLRVLRAKMIEWIDNGAQLAWLIDPERRAVEIFRPNSEPETLIDARSVGGDGLLAGFTLNLGRIWEPPASRR
jgi:Uma2 family endonuclease